MECLVTKLKAVVNDDSLPFLGGIRVKKAYVDSPSGDTQFISLASYSTIECIALKGAEFYSTNQLTSTIGNKVMADMGLLTWITNGGDFVIKNKYDLKEIGLSTLDSIQFSDLKGLSKIKRLELTGHTTNAIKADLSVFAESLPADMETLVLRKCNLTGDVSSLSHIALKKLVVSAQVGVNGDISLLNFSRLERLEVADTSVTGTLESIVAKAISSGRPTGSIVMPYMKAISNVTYQGLPLPSNSNVPSAGMNNTLSWTADGTITLS
jgi:hypothetical protein